MSESKSEQYRVYTEGNENFKGVRDENNELTHYIDDAGNQIPPEFKISTGKLERYLQFGFLSSEHADGLAALLSSKNIQVVPATKRDIFMRIEGDENITRAVEFLSTPNRTDHPYNTADAQALRAYAASNANVAAAIPEHAHPLPERASDDMGTPPKDEQANPGFWSTLASFVGQAIGALLRAVANFFSSPSNQQEAAEPLLDHSKNQSGTGTPIYYQLPALTIEAALSLPASKLAQHFLDDTYPQNKGDFANFPLHAVLASNLPPQKQVEVIKELITTHIGQVDLNATRNGETTLEKLRGFVNDPPPNFSSAEGWADLRACLQLPQQPSAATATHQPRTTSLGPP